MSNQLSRTPHTNPTVGPVPAGDAASTGPDGVAVASSACVPGPLTLAALARARGLSPDTLHQLGWQERTDGIVIPWPLLGGGADYVTLGERQNAGRADRWHVIAALLGEVQGDATTHPAGLTAVELYARWDDTARSVPRPGRRTLSADLERAVQRGCLRRSGSGRKGDPYRYVLPTPAAPGQEPERSEKSTEASARADADGTPANGSVQSETRRTE